jgi:hypothetical protein
MQFDNRNQLNLLSEERGFAMVASLLFLTLLGLLAFSILNDSRVELTISGNDHFYKKNFNAAEGGTEVGHELLEENLSCPDGFSADNLIIGKLRVFNKDFSRTHTADWKAANSEDTYPSDSKRDIVIPQDLSNDTQYERTNMKIFGQTRLATGAAIHMAAGYEGKGKAAAGGGGYMLHEIHSQHIGSHNGVSTVMIRWRHLIGQEGNTCKY